MLHYYLDVLNPMQKGNLLQLKNTICHRVIQIYGREIKEFY